MNTRTLRNKVFELLKELETEAIADKNAGRLVWAQTQFDLVHFVSEYIRILENGRKADKESRRVQRGLESYDDSPVVSER